MLNFSPDHLDRHPSVEAYGAAKARIFENQDAGDWAVDQRRRSGGARARAARARAGSGCSRAAAPIARGHGRSRTAGSSIAGDGARPSGWCRSTPIHLLGPHLVDDVMAAATVGAIAGARAGRDDRGGRVVSRPRARDGAGGRDRRRAVRQRLEGDQRRVGAAIDRELRRAAWCRSSAAGSRAAICGCCASRCAARAQAVVAIGEARPLVREALGGRRRRCARRRRSTRRSTRRSRWRSRQAWCCWRRRARASTCFATTRSADGRFKEEVVR